LLDSKKNVIEESFQLQDNQNGRKQLNELISKWFGVGLKKLYCGVESTGGYENNWYTFLKTFKDRSEVRVARLNAKGVKSVGDAGLKRTITDAVSAENIAVYLISFPDKVNYGEKLEETKEFKEGRQMYSYCKMLQKQRTQLNNQLEKLLYQYFPEVLPYCRNGMPGWLLRVLCKYPSAHLVVKAKEAKLSTIKGMSIARSKGLIRAASQSSYVVSTRIQHVITNTCAELLRKDQLIKGEKSYIKSLFEDNEQVQLLASIPCVGLDTAVAIILEIDNINRFDSSKKLASYFGVHPTYKQSGDGTWKVGMSKKGRGNVRALLYMASFTGIRCNPILKQIYHRFRAKGMKHYQAMGVVMYKLLRIVYGILKNQTPFDLIIDAKNIENAKTKQEENKEKKKVDVKLNKEKKFRYQNNVVDAPISRHQAKKRKEAAGVPNFNNEVQTGLPTAPEQTYKNV